MPASEGRTAEISRSLCDLYRRHGYVNYHMSKFEPYDLYARNRSFLVSEDILTFTDTDGRLMALKPDVTLSIVKNATPSDGSPEKIYYHENVYRTSPGSIGFREIPQAGLECIGELDDYSTGEVLSLAARSLAAISPDYLLDVGHMGIVAGALDGIDEALRRTLVEELGRKNTAAIRQLCSDGGVSEHRADWLCRLAELYGAPKDVLPVLRQSVEGGAAVAALGELETLVAMMDALGLGDRLRLDFSVIGGMRYYNGLIFRGYLPGLAYSVLAGGRYDDLLHQMGRHGGAIGFAVYLDRLERFGEDEAADDGDILLLYGEGDDPAAVAAEANRLAEDGSVVRVVRSAPAGLSFKRTVNFGKGGGR